MRILREQAGISSSTPHTASVLVPALHMSTLYYHILVLVTFASFKIDWYVWRANDDVDIAKLHRHAGDVMSISEP